MREAELDQAVAELCVDLGVHRFHVPDSRRVEFRGFPDLVLWGPRGLIFRELKSDQGRLSREQMRVHETLLDARQDIYVWRPWDLHEGVIDSELRQIR